MEGIDMLKNLLLRNDWMASINLNDAHLLVAENVGSTSASSGQTLKLVMCLLRQQGIRFLLLLDDMLVFAQPKEDLVAQMNQTAQLFNLLSFSINKKSQLTPAQQIQFLGFLIDSQSLMTRRTQIY